MDIINKNIMDLIPYINNPRKNDKAVDAVASSIKNFGFKVPIIIDSQNEIVAGHTRLKAAIKLNYKEVPCIVADDLTPAQIKAYRIADNKVSELAEWDMDILKIELEGLEDFTGFDIEDTLFDDEVVEDDYETEVPQNPICQKGDIWELGNHRLMCGDSTRNQDIDKLMNGKKAVLAHNDPPYGMKKEKDGILNDNLNYDDLLEFNKKWITLQFDYLEDNGSFYCWGIDEPLMDIYSEILKPMIKKQQATFRNLITWNKGNGQGQLSEEFRSYSIADEKCLFVMCGVQGFNNNADNYFKGWDGIVNYLKQEKEKTGLTIKDFKRIAGHSETSGCHWFDKSQWMIPTEQTYKAWQNYCKKEYNAFKKEYDEIKKEYDEIKKEYYLTRAYFNNTHDNINNVWNIKRTNNDEKELTGGHATPKPLELCQRVIKSSSKKNDIVIDMFGGSGSTLIACEQLNRICYMMELDEGYCDVIIKRWESFTGQKASKLKSL